ncbi:MAG: PGF-pre-PGF domain-containing protein [Candidatus Aenigmarchaeota archaeon]|nr:PGF-pre-PGF domain-containing protein [Candidatus Aenigmarchaeota archaeon]
MVSVSFAASPVFFSGYAHVNWSLAPNDTTIQAFVNNGLSSVADVAIGNGTLSGKAEGYYLIAMEKPTHLDNYDNVTFRINGVNTTNDNGSTTAVYKLLPGIQFITGYNISMNKSANGIVCTYASGCTGGFCVHNTCRSASTFCGDSYCDSGETCTSCSGDCGACSSSSSSSTGSGGGGVPAAVEATKIVESATPEAPAVVKIEAPKAADLKVDEISIDVKEAVSNIQVVVKESSLPSGAPAVVSSDTGAAYKYLEITTNVPSAKIEKAKIKFKVEKSWATSKSVDPNTVALSRYADKKWDKMPTTRTSEDSTFYYYEAETPGFSTFAITGEKASGFWDIINKINSYYTAKDVTFWQIIDLINLYYKK